MRGGALVVRGADNGGFCSDNIEGEQSDACVRALRFRRGGVKSEVWVRLAPSLWAGIDAKSTNPRSRSIFGEASGVRVTETCAPALRLPREQRIPARVIRARQHRLS
jgi:hypothetical protein